MLNDRQNSKNINQNLKNKNSSLVTFFVLLFATTFFCFYSFNNEAYFRIYLTYANKLQKQKKVDSKTETDEDKFLLIFFAIGITILFFFIIFYIVKKFFFPSSDVDLIENYYKAIEKVNEENKKDWRKLRQELDKDSLQSYVKNHLSKKQLEKGILEQCRICFQYLRNIEKSFRKSNEKFGENFKFKKLKTTYDYLVLFTYSIKKAIKEEQKDIKDSINFNDIAKFNERVVKFRNDYNLYLLEQKKFNEDDDYQKKSIFFNFLENKNDLNEFEDSNNINNINNDLNEFITIEDSNNINANLFENEINTDSNIIENSDNFEINPNTNLNEIDTTSSKLKGKFIRGDTGNKKK